MPATNRHPTVTRLEVQGDVLSPRSTPAAATVGDIIYIVGGGYDSDLEEVVIAYNDIHAFDTTTSTLTELHPSGTPPPPSFFAAGAADETNGHVYVFGGSSYDHGIANLTIFGDLHRYSVADNEWTLAAPASEGPGPRVRPNLWSYGAHIYAFGGLDHQLQNHNDIWRFSTIDHVWEQVADDIDTPKGRYEAASGNTSHDGKAYALGGENMRAAEFRPVLVPGTLEIDLDSGVIRRLPIDRPNDVTGAMRHQAAAATLEGTLYVYGGDDPHNKKAGCGAPYPQGPIGQIWSLDVANNSWHLSDHLGAPLKRTVASAANNKMYVFGGYGFECEDGVGPGQIWNTDIYVIDPT